MSNKPLKATTDPLLAQRTFHHGQRLAPNKLAFMVHALCTGNALPFIDVYWYR